MAGMTKQALRFAENLTLPTGTCFDASQFQVIVMTANMSCSHCRQRASLMMSKMNGLLDFEVDVPNKEVIMRGAVDLKKGKSREEFSESVKSRKKFTCFSCFSS